MKRWKYGLALACGLACLPTLAPSAAQSIEARKIPNARFVKIEMIKFKPGGEDRAFDLEDKYIDPARKLSGVWPLAEYHTQTGPWDRIYVWALPGGLADAEWQVDPSQAKFLAALSKIAGGDDKALAIITEWNSLVERRESTIGHYHPR
jgi:hypothetical protein